MPESNPNLATLTEGMSRYRLPIVAEQTLTFKMASFSLMVAHFSTADLERIKRELAAKVAQAPTFFQDTAMVLDFQAIDGQPVNLQELMEILHAHGINPIGVRHADIFQQTEARALGMVLFPPGRKDEARTSDQRVKPKICTQPVRSGQQMYAPNGDLVVLAMVNSGAEILADGNIHCYAPLRGRALAGVKGDTDARIFTYCLEAELLSIAGFYRVIENIRELPPNVRSKPAQISLTGDRLVIEAI